MDLHRQFDALAGPEVAPTTEDANSDLDRGRRALRRRRAVQKLAGSAFALVALAAGVVIANANAPATTTPSAGKNPGAISAPATRLVAYTGSQPKGYTIDKVPDGWEIQADTTSALVLAPKNAPDKNPQSFVGKIAIMLQSTDQKGVPEGKKAKVGDAAGVLVNGTGNDGVTLWVEQPNGVYLLLQFWNGLGLSEQDMLGIGAGVHVHKDAEQGHG